MYLPVPSTGLQLTFHMNSPYVPVFNVCHLPGHFGNVVNRSLPSRAICKYAEHGHWSSRGEELSRVGG